MIKPMLIHLPHSSLDIPSHIREDILLDDSELEYELLRITDRYTEQLFNHADVSIHKNVFSRIVFDPERFRDDSNEAMAKVGMGAIYMNSIDGRQMRRISENRREELMKRFYDPYHLELEQKVQMLLDTYGKCLILDGHSFPQVPLPFEFDRNPDRPDICIGTSDYHTPRELCDVIVEFVRKNGFTVKLDSPFAGTMVPMKYYLKDQRVASVMIEINRKLYMDEDTGEKNASFDKVGKLIHNLICEMLHLF